uniref:Uncharacterized protein K0253H11.26 n=1 Tax=Oryza sativa subsp. indica TaxID=39946 RepID=C8TFL6_ORYSI|nr:hypothetical protein [Oryza sativa Indica Group]
MATAARRQATMATVRGGAMNSAATLAAGGVPGYSTPREGNGRQRGLREWPERRAQDREQAGERELRWGLIWDEREGENWKNGFARVRQGRGGQLPKAVVEAVIDSAMATLTIKSTGTLAYPKASFRPALELSRSARPRVLLKKKIQQLSLSEVNEGNIVTITPDKLTPDQQKDCDAMMQQARNQFLNSFMQTRKGTVVQKYIVKVVADVPGTGSSKDGEGKQAPDGSAQPSNKGAADGSQGNQGDSSQGVQGVQGDGAHGVQGEGPNQDGNTAQLQFNNFQHQVDYAVHHALINQSGILVNTLSNIVKTMVDGSMAEYQATGPVYLPGGMFPNYRPLITDNQPVV